MRQQQTVWKRQRHNDRDTTAATAPAGVSPKGTDLNTVMASRASTVVPAGLGEIPLAHPKGATLAGVISAADIAWSANPVCSLRPLQSDLASPVPPPEQRARGSC